MYQVAKGRCPTWQMCHLADVPSSAGAHASRCRKSTREAPLRLNGKETRLSPSYSNVTIRPPLPENKLTTGIAVSDSHTWLVPSARPPPGTLASYKVSVHSNRESANPLPHNYNHRGSYTPSD